MSMLTTAVSYPLPVQMHDQPENGYANLLHLLACRESFMQLLPYLLPPPSMNPLITVAVCVQRSMCKFFSQVWTLQ